MEPKPAHLGPDYAAQFQDAAVVAAYGYRPAYPAETFDILTALISGEPLESTILDLGCGTGDLSRPLAQRVGLVDAIDISAPMIAQARSLPGGDDPRIRWIVAPAESAPLDPPYGLVTAAESLHWMDWEIVLPRIASVLTRGGVLSTVIRRELDNPWWPELLAIIQRYTTNREFRPYDTVAELESRGLFEMLGQRSTSPIPVRQTLHDYIESIHSRNGFSRDRMTSEAASAFDAECRALLAPVSENGFINFSVAASVIWGAPR
jgi:SAM-dependent methyltransferase